MNKNDKLTIISNKTVFVGIKNKRGKLKVWREFNSNDVIPVLENLKIDKDDEVIIRGNKFDSDFMDKVHSLFGNNLRLSPMGNQNKKNVSKTIADVYPNYTYDEYIKKDKILDLYAKSLKEHLDKDGDLKKLSPLELFVAVYTIVTNFAVYRLEDNNRLQNHTSRSVYEFIDNHDDRRIVCTGYVNLLRELLERVGKYNMFALTVDVSKDPKNKDTHMRFVIRIVDPKYNIDGVYICDPTFDSRRTNKTSEKAKINHMLMSKDEAKEQDAKEGYTTMLMDESTYELIEKIDHLNMKNIRELHKKPIPKDTIVKAFLAVDHFVDKNMKMVENNEYSFEEYVSMASNLGYEDLANKYICDYLFNEKPSDILTKYREYSLLFTVKLTKKIIEELNNRNITLNEPFVNFDYGTNKMGISYFLKKTIPREILDKIISKYHLTHEIRSTVSIECCGFSDVPISEQFDNLINACIEFSNYYDELNNTDNKNK